MEKAFFSGLAMKATSTTSSIEELKQCRHCYYTTDRHDVKSSVNP